MSLIEKWHAARRQSVTVDGRTFTFERPTAKAVQRIAALSARLPPEQVGEHVSESLLKHVVDWPGMREMDIIPGGTGAPVAFDQELFLAWVSDQPTVADAVSNAVMQSWLDHNAAIEAAQKKPETGINPDPSPVS